LEASGGVVRAASGEELRVPAGTATGSMVFALERIAPDHLGAALPQGTELVDAMLVSFSGQLSGPAALAIPLPASLPDASAGVLTRLQEIGGVTRFVFAGVARIDGDRLVSEVVVPGLPDALDGVRQEGRYAFLRVAAPIGFVTGQVTAVAGGP